MFCNCSNTPLYFTINRSTVLKVINGDQRAEYDPFSAGAAHRVPPFGCARLNICSPRSRAYWTV